MFNFVPTLNYLVDTRSTYQVWGLGKFCVRPGRHIIIDSQKWNVIQYCLQAYNVQKTYIHTSKPNLILQKNMDFSSAKSTGMYSLTRKTPRCFVFTRPRGSIVNTMHLTAFTLFPKLVPKHPPGGIIVQHHFLDFLQLCSESVSICFYLEVEEIPVWVYVFSTCKPVYCFPLIYDNPDHYRPCLPKTHSGQLDKVIFTALGLGQT